MAYTTVNKGSLFQNQVIYSGNGSARTISGVGFQPDLTWIKSRSGTAWHQLTDSVRGTNYQIASNSNGLGGTSVQGITSWNSDGFALGTNGDFNSGSNTFVGWNWKAGTAVSGNTGGSGSYKTYTGSVNTTSGFSIIKYTGNGTAGHTIPHHLGVAPSMMIIKITAGDTSDWYVYHKSLGNTGILFLSAANAASNSNAYWNSTTPTSSSFTVGDQTGNNSNNNTFISYNFAEVPGFSQFGSYTGNGNADGPFIFTGFKPAFVLIKNSSQNNGWWQMTDNARSPFNVVEKAIFSNVNDAEYDSANYATDFVSNGFKLRNSTAGSNVNNDVYIYMAFGQTLVGTNNVPANAG
jgi:hypothetical protein